MYKEQLINVLLLILIGPNSYKIYNFLSNEMLETVRHIMCPTRV